jgi:hypothetical protein
VNRVDRVLPNLKPVEVLRHAGNVAYRTGHFGEVSVSLLERFHAVITREGRLAVGRSHIYKHQAIALLNRVPRLTAKIAAAASIGLTCLFETMALNVILPAVVAATNTVVLNSAVVEAATSVRTPFEHYTGAAFTVAEND